MWNMGRTREQSIKVNFNENGMLHDVDLLTVRLCQSSIYGFTTSLGDVHINWSPRSSRGSRVRLLVPTRDGNGRLFPSESRDNGQREPPESNRAARRTSEDASSLKTRERLAGEQW
jgi:hypothetical protein